MTRRHNDLDVFQFILVVAKCEDATEMVLKDMQTVSGYNPITIKNIGYEKVTTQIMRKDR